MTRGPSGPARSGRGPSGDVIVVPLTPAALIDPNPVQPRREDIDDLVDDLFGEAPGEGPGAFDGLLVAGGAASMILGAVRDIDGLLVAGGLAVSLGLVLPVRSLSRRVALARRERRIRAAHAKGLPLFVAHPVTARLLAGYLDVLEASANPGMPLGSDSLGAAHRALVEAASVLGGEAPLTQPEVDYVTTRADAVAGLAAALRRQQRSRLEGLLAPEPADFADRRIERAALARARAEVDEISGVASIHEIKELTAAMNEGADDAR